MFVVIDMGDAIFVYEVKVDVSVSEVPELEAAPEVLDTEVIE